MADSTTLHILAAGVPQGMLPYLLDELNTNGFRPQGSLCGDETLYANGFYLELYEASGGDVDQAEGVLRSVSAEGLSAVDCKPCEGTGQLPDGRGTCLGCAGEGTRDYPPCGFAWYVHDEPAGEWQGTVYVHHPTAGDYNGSCDSDGTPSLTADEVIAALDAATTLDGARAAVDTLTGRKVTAAWAELWAKTTTAPTTTDETAAVAVKVAAL